MSVFFSNPYFNIYKECNGGNSNVNFSFIKVKKIEKPQNTTKIVTKKTSKEIPSVILSAREDIILLQFGGTREDILKFYNKFENFQKVRFFFLN